ncbi:hypothetical protein C8F01DRAFT_676898 [Mycena amicta]|nr:hypothetical protein C8F01DRAFT_676898 [Mycena amicta]
MCTNLLENHTGEGATLRLSRLHREEELARLAGYLRLRSFRQPLTSGRVMIRRGIHPYSRVRSCKTKTCDIVALPSSLSSSRRYQAPALMSVCVCPLSIRRSCPTSSRTLDTRHGTRLWRHGHSPAERYRQLVCRYCDPDADISRKPLGLGTRDEGFLCLPVPVRRDESGAAAQHAPAHVDNPFKPSTLVVISSAQGKSQAQALKSNVSLGRQLLLMSVCVCPLMHLDTRTRNPAVATCIWAFGPIPAACPELHPRSRAFGEALLRRRYESESSPQTLTAGMRKRKRK